MKKSRKTTDYCYIHPLRHIQILAQPVHYSSRNGFSDYGLIILTSISFQFCYWRSNKRKILEKSQSNATYIHYIIYKLQLNPFTITEVFIFLGKFSNNNFAAHFLKSRNFTITNLKVITRLHMHQLTFFLMFPTIFSINFHCIWENQFSNFVYLSLDRITFKENFTFF